MVSSSCLEARIMKRSSSEDPTTKCSRPAQPAVRCGIGAHQQRVSLDSIHTIHRCDRSPGAARVSHGSALRDGCPAIRYFIRPVRIIVHTRGATRPGGRSGGRRSRFTACARGVSRHTLDAAIWGSARVGLTINEPESHNGYPHPLMTSSRKACSRCRRPADRNDP